jgi:geranylgeranyl pyrophosphate synthase
MIRPLLVFASTGAVGGNPECAVQAAQAVELLHAASLVHDDIIDESDLRRGWPALHREVGPAAALVLGDYLIMLAFSMLAQAVESQPPQRVARAVGLFAHQAALCCTGELDDLRRGAILDASCEYVSIVRRKTAANFVAAAMLGGLFGGASNGEIENLASYARAFGIVYQVEDDLLDQDFSSERRAEAEALRDFYLRHALDALDPLRPSSHVRALQTLAHETATSMSYGRPESQSYAQEMMLEKKTNEETGRRASVTLGKEVVADVVDRWALSR